MDLCLSNGKKCDKQMFVTRTADANLKTGRGRLREKENKMYVLLSLIKAWAHVF